MPRVLLHVTCTVKPRVMTVCHRESAGALSSSNGASAEGGAHGGRRCHGGASEREAFIGSGWQKRGASEGGGHRGSGCHREGVRRRGGRGRRGAVTGKGRQKEGCSGRRGCEAGRGCLSHHLIIGPVPKKFSMCQVLFELGFSSEQTDKCPPASSSLRWGPGNKQNK
jgi:hypothetical protein